MQPLGHALLALLLASLFTALELITTKYPKTYFFFTPRNSPSLYGYSLIYGLAALAIVLASDQLNLARETGVSNPWIQAIIIGMSLKAFLHLRLFTVPPRNPGDEPFPVGLETVTLLFEPTLLDNIHDNEDSGLYKLLDPCVQKYQNKDDVRLRIMQHVPQRIRQDKDLYKAFEGDLDEYLNAPYTPIFDAMVLLLKLAGRQNFEQAFPS